VRRMYREGRVHQADRGSQAQIREGGTMIWHAC
jgi:hypothetical protein